MYRGIRDPMVGRRIGHSAIAPYRWVELLSRRPHLPAAGPGEVHPPAIKVSRTATIESPGTSGARATAAKMATTRKGTARSGATAAPVASRQSNWTEGEHGHAC